MRGIECRRVRVVAAGTMIRDSSRCGWYGQVVLVTVTAMLLVVAGCKALPAPRSRFDDSDEIEDNRLQRPPGPAFAERPGREALLRWVEECRELGVAREPEVFARAGEVVIRWAADRAGDLLRLEFPADSFRGWEVARGQTLADCVVEKAQQADLRWSREGTAPLRIPESGVQRAPDPATQTTHPTSAPALPALPAGDAGPPH